MGKLTVFLPKVLHLEIFFAVENKQKLSHIMQKDSFRSGVLENDSVPLSSLAYMWHLNKMKYNLKTTTLLKI